MICLFNINFNAGQFTLQVIHCSSADCTNYSITEVDQDSGGSCSIQISPNGLPIITYLEIINYTYKGGTMYGCCLLKGKYFNSCCEWWCKCSIFCDRSGWKLTSSLHSKLYRICYGCSLFRFKMLECHLFFIRMASLTLPRVILSGDGFPLIFCNSTIGHCNGIQIYLTNK